MPLPYKLWALLLMLVGAGSALHPTREADVFFHLELGRAVLEHRARTVPEPHAFPGFEPTCMAPAWLWDVLAYGLHSAGGFVALSLFTLASAIAASASLAVWLRGWLGASSFVPWALVSAATLTCAATRFEMRPQTLAIALLVGYLIVLQQYAAALGASRLRLGVLVVVLALAWAQLHGSFVLAPVLFAIVVGAQAWQRWVAADPYQLPLSAADGRHDPRRLDLMTLAFTTLTLASSAAGLDVLAYIGDHGYGDAVQYIHEMRPPSWAELTALRGASGKSLVLLWLLSLFGLTRDGRFQGRAIALALLGHLLLSRAQRFIAEDAILCAPLALAGASNIAAWSRSVLRPALRRALPALAVVGSLALLGSSVRQSNPGYGASFGLGLDAAAFPQLSAAYLRRMAPGTRVLTAFGAGPALGFWSNGALRTYVDGRTPLYFDDTDYAVEREVFTNELALERAIERFGVRAAVVERAHGVCDLLARRWHAVVIEATYSTFVPPELDSALTGLDPCGPVYVHAEAADDLAGLDRSLARLAKLGAAPFLDFLAAERSLLVAGADPMRVLALLDRSESALYERPHRRARIDALLRGGALDDAYGLMMDALREGDVSVLRFVAAPGLGSLEVGRARELLELGVGQLGEAASPATRSMLAALCVEQGDARCARFNGLRAAARAAPNVEPTLAWLSRHAETARMRADAHAWLELLRAERAAAARD